MSVAYIPVQWNRTKWVYDAILVAMVLLYLGLYLRVGPIFADQTAPVDGAIFKARAFGTCAFFMLSFILCIGPLARLDPRFLPLLYNRRHFGVLTALVALGHANFVLDWYFAFSPTPPLVGLLGANTAWDRWPGLPFEAFGIAALLTLGVLAATSHDFWLSFLTPRVWKALHMAIYPAYAALVMHIGFGALQGAGNPLFPVAVALSVVAVAALHWAAREPWPRAAGDWHRVGLPDEIAEGTAKVVPLPDGTRVAVFRHEGTFSAISNACAHQNGPLGEGRIVDGCVTCPWHGFQYDVRTGCSPAPFTERVPTYDLAWRDGAIWVAATPHPPGTPRAPLEVPS